MCCFTAAWENGKFCSKVKRKIASKSQTFAQLILINYGYWDIKF
jgi:hypothetical protein